MGPTFSRERSGISDSMTPFSPLTDPSFMSPWCPSLLHTSNVGSVASVYTLCQRSKEEKQRRKDQRCGHKLNICFCPLSVFLDIFLSHINCRTFKPIPPVSHRTALACAKRMNAIYMYLKIKTPWRGCKGDVGTAIAKGLEQHWWNCCQDKKMG